LRIKELPLKKSMLWIIAFAAFSTGVLQAQDSSVPGRER